VVPLIPDSQDLPASASYDTSTVSSTSVTSDNSVPQPNTQAHLGADSFVASTENSSRRTQGTLITESSPAGSSSYRPSTNQLQDSGSAEPASINQEVLPESTRTVSQRYTEASHQSDLLNPVLPSKKLSFQSDSTPQSHSLEHLQLTNPLSEIRVLSEEREVSRVFQEPHFSDAITVPIQTPITQASQALLSVGDSEDEGYSEPPTSELVDRLVINFVYLFRSLLSHRTGG
jgi:hypothetical protein